MFVAHWIESSTQRGGSCRRARWYCTIVFGALVLVLAAEVQAQSVVIDLKTDAVPIRVDAGDSGDHFGTDFSVCDFDGDGLLDLVIGAEEAAGPDNSRAVAGEVYLIRGRRGSWTGEIGIEALASLQIFGAVEFGGAGHGVDCGDLSGDGMDDIVVGATGDNGPGGSRSHAGNIYLVYGYASPSGTLDLATTNVPVIFGEAVDDQAGSQLAVGDVDGDGSKDLAIGAHPAMNRLKTGWQAGRAYLLLGRSNWPATLDLRTESDVKFYGAVELDNLGAAVEIRDLDRDGMDELLLDARLGDGPGDTRLNAGEVHIFWGRSSWPAEFDLAVGSSDVMIYGPDAGDQIGTYDGISFGDLDVDGTIDLALGVSRADGPTNNDSGMGEARLLELGSAPAAEIDAGASAYATLWGGDADDDSCGSTKVGDINGDGVEDLVCSASTADGPDNTRFRGGDVLVFVGPFQDPGNRDAAQGEHDVVVYGANAEDSLFLGGLADLNADGLWELVVVTNYNLPETGKQAMWFLSPYDTDGDGLSQLEDNCPLVANPLQEDADGDLIGDACDGDYDGDGQSDAEDCAPNRAADGVPPEVTGVRLSGKTITAVEWDPALFSTIYNVERGLLTLLDGSNYGACQDSRDPILSDTEFIEDETPSAGDGFFYLVRGVNIGCPAAGSRGKQSIDEERGNSNPSACASP